MLDAMPVSIVFQAAISATRLVAAAKRRGRIEISARRQRRDQQARKRQRGEHATQTSKQGDEAVALPAIQSGAPDARSSWTEDVGEPLGVLFRVGQRLGGIEGHQLDVARPGKPAGSATCGCAGM